jgi:4-hydroxyphenylpyruvate dioxygenase
VSENPLRLKRLHHAEFWVGNAKQAAFYYTRAFGFSRFAYQGLETGHRDRSSYALHQGKVRFVLSSALEPDSQINDFVRRHGDGVKDLAFEVENADFAYEEALRRGAGGIIEPHTISDENGSVRHAAIATYGDTIHSLYDIQDYNGPFLPGYVQNEEAREGCGLLIIDHCVGNVDWGEMEATAKWYEDVMGFSRYITFDDTDISTEFTALQSIVMSNDQASIRFPINEPAKGKKKSQIAEYVEAYHGQGVQHVAMLTKDILATVAQLRANGVEFLEVPDTYYETVWDRVGDHVAENRDEIRKLRILVDSDDEGYLLQLFTQPVQDRPTLFFEIIQRVGARGFGKGNFKALFESIEREQELRGNL